MKYTIRLEFTTTRGPHGEDYFEDISARIDRLLLQYPCEHGSVISDIKMEDL